MLLKISISARVVFNVVRLKWAKINETGKMTVGPTCLVGHIHPDLWSSAEVDLPREGQGVSQMSDHRSSGDTYLVIQYTVYSIVHH